MAGVACVPDRQFSQVWARRLRRRNRSFALVTIRRTYTRKTGGAKGIRTPDLCTPCTSVSPDGVRSGLVTAGRSRGTADPSGDDHATRRVRSCRQTPGPDPRQAAPAARPRPARPRRPTKQRCLSTDSFGAPGEGRLPRLSLSSSEPTRPERSLRSRRSAIGSADPGPAAHSVIADADSETGVGLATLLAVGRS
jgi:hypothetical protein